LTPLTSVSIAHHQDTGFDQANDLDRARNSDRIDISVQSNGHLLVLILS
jgi:hypothetical protein